MNHLTSSNQIAAAHVSWKSTASTAARTESKVGQQRLVDSACRRWEAWTSSAVWQHLATGVLVITFWLLIVAATFMDQPPGGAQSDHPVPARAPVAGSADPDDDVKAWLSG